MTLVPDNNAPYKIREELGHRMASWLVVTAFPNVGTASIAHRLALGGRQWPLAVGSGSFPEMGGRDGHGLAFATGNSSLQGMKKLGTHQPVVCLLILADK